MNLHFAPEQFNLWWFIQELVIRTWNSTNNYDIWLALFIEELVIWTWNFKNWTFPPEIELLVVHPRIGELNLEFQEMNFTPQKLNFWWFIQELVTWTWNSKNWTFPPGNWTFGCSSTNWWLEPGSPRIKLFLPEVEFLVVHPRIGDLNLEFQELNFSPQKIKFWP